MPENYRLLLSWFSYLLLHFKIQFCLVHIDKKNEFLWQFVDKLLCQILYLVKSRYLNLYAYVVVCSINIIKFLIDTANIKRILNEKKISEKILKKMRPTHPIKTKKIIVAVILIMINRRRFSIIRDCWIFHAPRGKSYLSSKRRRRWFPPQLFDKRQKETFFFFGNGNLETVWRNNFAYFVRYFKRKIWIIFG